jgi:hypothetical protein
MGTDRYSTTWPRRGSQSPTAQVSYPWRAHAVSLSAGGSRPRVKGGFTGYAPHIGETCRLSQLNRNTVWLFRWPYFSDSGSLAIFAAITGSDEGPSGWQNRSCIALDQNLRSATGLKAIHEPISSELFQKPAQLRRASIQVPPAKHCDPSRQKRRSCHRGSETSV